MSHANRAYVLSSSGGQAVWFVGSLAPMKASSSDTHNAFALQEQICPSGLQPPLHLHHLQDEAFYILEGEVTVTRGEQVWRATAGSFAFLPKRVAHTFKVEGSTPARMLRITSPGDPFGFEYFVQEMGDPAPTLTFPMLPTGEAYELRPPPFCFSFPSASRPRSRCFLWYIASVPLAPGVRDGPVPSVAYLC